MNKDNDYFDDHDKYPKVGLLNEEIVKDDFADASKKKVINNYQQIELSDYQPLPDDYDKNGTKPTFNPRNNNTNAAFSEDKKNNNPFKNNNKPPTQNMVSPPPPPPIQRPQPPVQPIMQAPMPMMQPPMYILNPQALFYQPPSFPGNFNSIIPPMQPNPTNYHMPVTCPRCSLYQAVPINSNGFICPRCNNVISVFNLNSQSKILVCDKCKSNVIYQVGSSPLIECSHCKTINYAAINDPKNIYGPKKQ